MQTSVAPPRRRWIASRVVLPLLAVVLGCEVAVLALEPSLPPVVDHSTRDYEAKIEQMDALAASGGADVVFAGTSQVMFSVDPAVLEDSGAAWSSYNAAVPGGVPTINAHWLLDEVVPRIQPSTVVYGIGPIDLHRTATTMELEERYYASRSVRDDLLGRLERWTAGVSALVRNRESLRQPDVIVKSALDRVRGRTQASAIEEITAFRGLDAGGHASQFDPHKFTTDRFPIAPQDLADYSVGPEVMQAIEETVVELHDRGIDVVLLALPVADEMAGWLPGGTDDIERAMDALRDVAARTDTPILDLATGMSDEFWFADPMHLNRVGASVFNAALASVFSDADDRLESVAASWTGGALVTSDIRRSAAVVRAAQALYPRLDLAAAAPDAEDPLRPDQAGDGPPIEVPDGVVPDPSDGGPVSPPDLPVPTSVPPSLPVPTPTVPVPTVSVPTTIDLPG